MGFSSEHRGRGPKVFVPGTGQFLNSTCIRTICTVVSALISNMAYYFYFYCFTLIILNIHWNKWIEKCQASMHGPLNSVTKCFPNMLDSDSV